MRSINAPAAWVRSLGNGQTVAVLDSGIDSGHPEFDGQLVDGYDFVEDDSSYEDDNGHGTHVAGIVAAKSNNGLGIAGVAWNAKIRPVKVLNASGVGSHADVAEAIRWSADQGDRIINLSLGSTANSTTLRDAIDYAYNKGVLIVAAAGNQAQAGNPTIYPAAYDHVLAVGSVTANQQRADYSSYGPYVDLAAPGGSGSGTGLGARIWSTYPRNISNGNSVTGYKDVAGTSQAAPHVSGVAALVLALNPGLGPDQVAAILQESATDLGAPGRDEHFGAGLLNAAGAVNRTVGVMAAASNERPIVPAAAPQPATVDAPFVPGELIVGLSTEVTAAAAQVLADEFNLSIQRAIAPVSYVVTVTPGEEMRLARELAADPRVRYAEPNYLVFSQ
jgi:subtilisin family serine protease